MQRPLILIVDPDGEERGILRRYLERHGYPSVMETGDGVLGLELADKMRPDLIIGDFPLDVRRHSPFLEALRQEIGSDAAILVVTSREIDTPHMSAEATLKKPVRPSEVAEQVDRILNRLG